MTVTGSDINPADAGTWVQPVALTRETTPLVHKASIEYTVPMSPNALIMAMLQLPPDIPRSPYTFVRTMPSKSNVTRDGRHKGGFIVELVWPLEDLSTLPMDTDDDEGEEVPVRKHRARTSRTRTAR